MGTGHVGLFRLAAALAVLTIPLFSQSARAELTTQQKQFLATIDTRLKQAEANLKAAEESAGPADQKPSASRANLSLSRSGSARAQLKTVTDALAKLPADDAAVKAVADRATKAETSINSLEKRLTGEPPSPAGKPPAGDPPPAGKPPAGQPPPPAGKPAGVRLDYKQEKLLKDAEFHIDSIENAAASLAKAVEQVKAAKDPDRIDHRVLVTAMADIEYANGRKKLTDGYFAQLPKDGAGVGPASDRVTAAMEKVATAAKTLTPIHERLQKLINPASYPKLEEDTARMQGLGQMFNDPNVLGGNPERAAEVVKQLPAAKEELERYTKAYGVLVEQQTDAGKRVEGVTRFLTENVKKFDDAAIARKKALPGEIQADLGKVNQLADEAVKEKKPLFFRGGIPQFLEAAQRKLALLAALDAEGSAASTKAVADVREQMKRKQASLSDLIIADNPLPPDRYTGADKAALTERAIAAWKEKQPDVQVLTVRFPSEKWTRETMWRRQNTTWYKIDRSSLQAQLIVKHTDKLAAIRPINLWTDHLDGDKVAAFPLHGSAKEELQPQELLAVEKVK